MDKRKKPRLNVDDFFLHLITALNESRTSHNGLRIFSEYYHTQLTKDRQQSLNNIKHIPQEKNPCFIAGYTPLMYAIEYNCKTMTHYILQECGANPETISTTNNSNQPLTAITIALKKGYFNFEGHPT